MPCFVIEYGYNVLVPLQALSKRIHYGKFVAEAKYLESHELYEPAIKAKVTFHLPYNTLFYIVTQYINVS